MVKWFKVTAKHVSPKYEAHGVLIKVQQYGDDMWIGSAADWGMGHAHKSPIAAAKDMFLANACYAVTVEEVEAQ